MQRLATDSGRAVVYCNHHGAYMQPHCPGFEPDPDYVPAAGDHCELCGAMATTETPNGMMDWRMIWGPTWKARDVARFARDRGVSIAQVFSEMYRELEASNPALAAAVSPTWQTFTFWGDAVVQEVGGE